MNRTWAAALVTVGLMIFAIAQVLIGPMRPKAVVLALRENEVRELATRSAYPLQDLWERARAIGVNAVMLSPDIVSAGQIIILANPATEDFEAHVRAARDRGAFIAWMDSTPLAGPVPSIMTGARAMLAEIFTPQPVPGQLWRAIFGRGARLLVVPMPPEFGVETNLTRLRRITGQLRGAEFALDASNAAEPLLPWNLAGTLRCWLAFLLAVVAPMLAVRQGLAALRCVSCKTQWPQAYPAPELALAIVRTAAVATGAGLACWALLNLPGWDLGLWRPHWNAWSFGVPLIISVYALYAEHAKRWRKLLAPPLIYKEAIQMAGLVAVVWLLIRPPHWPVYWLGEGFWWFSLRWREALVGVPCLLMAFRIRLRHLESKHPDSKHAHSEAPRLWLILGLLAPIGTLHAFGLGLMPPEMLLAQTLQVWAIGSVLGAFLIAVRTKIRN